MINLEFTELYPCQVFDCNKKFITPDERNTHQRIYHAHNYFKSKLLEVCKDCERQDKKDSDMIHMTKDDKYKCMSCGRVGVDVVDIRYSLIKKRFVVIG